MEKIKIITDSTASIPPAILAQYPEIGIVPLYIQFGDQSFKEGIDITNADFYTKLAAASQLPTTSQPSAGDFVEAYKPWLDQGYSIISAHIGTTLSGTVASALAAKQMLNGDIEVLDSESSGMCLGFVAMEGARALRAGKSKAEILARMNAVKDGVRVLFAVDTLEYLKKGGRIGGAQALLGSILQIKPILIIRDGRIDVLEKVRTSKKARQRLMDIAGEVQQRLPESPTEAGRARSRCVSIRPAGCGGTAPALWAGGNPPLYLKRCIERPHRPRLNRSGDLGRGEWHGLPRLQRSGYGVLRSQIAVRSTQKGASLAKLARIACGRSARGIVSRKSGPSRTKELPEGSVDKSLRSAVRKSV